MTEIAYVNGRYLPQHEATVSLNDRGLQFADSVYEVIAAHCRKLLDAGLHYARLKRSLDAVAIPMQGSPDALHCIAEEVIRRNRREDAAVYIQITRGSAPREHVSMSTLKPSLFVTLLRTRFPDEIREKYGVAVMTWPDQRWARCDIKTSGLLPNVLAKQEAVRRGCKEAVLVNASGHVTEGSSTNFMIVDDHGRLLTHPADHRILGGVTRDVVLHLAAELGVAVVERDDIRVEECYEAAEAFLTGTTTRVMPVTAMDGHTIGAGSIGPITERLQARYKQHITQQTGKQWQ